MLHKPERIKLFTSKIVILILVDEGRPHSDQLCFVGIKPVTVVLPKLFTLQQDQVQYRGRGGQKSYVPNCSTCKFIVKAYRWVASSSAISCLSWYWILLYTTLLHVTYWSGQLCILLCGMSIPRPFFAKNSLVNSLFHSRSTCQNIGEQIKLCCVSDVKHGINGDQES